jgi:hypothetical protein
MNFKAYDILSSLIPGFLAVLVSLQIFEFKFDKDLIVPYTAVAFLYGYIMNTLSSWLEGFYFWTWRGKPSNKLLDGKNIWKVKFYHSLQARALLLGEANPSASNDELFCIAMRHANTPKDTRVEDFNAMYAFSRALLTTVFVGTIILSLRFYNDWRFYATALPILFIVWLRCKQRAYYYSKEVLTVYLKIKNP